MTLAALSRVRDEDLYAHYARLRSHSPCLFDEESRCFLLTRYQDVLAVLKNHEDFSSARPIALKKERISDGLKIILLSDDPPRHTHVRNLVQRWFTARSIAAMAPWIETIAADLLSHIEHDTLDVAQQLAQPLPIMTIAKLLGIDPGEWRTLRSWSAAAAGLVDAQRGAHIREMFSFFGYFSRQIRSRHECPLDDLITHIIHGNAVGAALTDAQLQSFCVLLVISGSETTTNLLSNALWLLATRPTLWRSLRDGETSVAAVVDETLRFESPIQIVSRVLTRAAEINGWQFQQGDVVACCLGAANRDPGEFLEPDSFDPSRPGKRALAFGHGIHFCLGAALARLEVEIVLTALLRRYRAIGLLAGAARIQSSIVRGFDSLPLQVQG